METRRTGTCERSDCSAFWQNMLYKNSWDKSNDCRLLDFIITFQSAWMKSNRSNKNPSAKAWIIINFLRKLSILYINLIRFASCDWFIFLVFDEHAFSPQVKAVICLSMWSFLAHTARPLQPYVDDLTSECPRHSWFLMYTSCVCSSQEQQTAHWKTLTKEGESEFIQA